MGGKERYNKYKGMIGRMDGCKAVVCGYDSCDLIVAILDGQKSWTGLSDDDNIVTHKNNILGYAYMCGNFDRLHKSSIISIKIN